MNTITVKANYKSFCIILDSGCSYTILMGRIVNKLGLEKDALMQWNTQARNITTDIKLDFTLPALSATNIVMWNCHVN